MTSIKTALITGANAGLGKDAARQLAGIPTVERIFLACRNADKAEAARVELVEKTGRDIFSFVHLDTSDPTTVDKAVASLPVIDGVVLNAGGAGGASAGEITEQGVTQQFAVNVLGHVSLVEGLIAAGKLTDTVVYVSSEAVRGIPAMRMQRVDLPEFSVEDFTKVADGSYFGRFDAMTAYGYTKHVGTLWTSAMARRHPALRFVSVSPGATTGTSATDQVGPVQRFIFTKIAFPLMTLFGRAHGVEQGAKRYIDVLTDDQYASGRFYASPWPSTSGDLVDQATVWDELANEAHQDNAVVALQQWTDNRASAAV